MSNNHIHTPTNVSRNVRLIRRAAAALAEVSPGTELERELRAAAAVPLWKSVLAMAPEVDLCNGYQQWARDLRDAWVITPETGPDPQIVFGEAEAWATVRAYSGAVSIGRVCHHLALEWAAEEMRCFYMTQGAT